MAPFDIMNVMAIKVNHIEPKFTDKRGGLALIIDRDDLPIKSVLRITSKAGTVRGNHYHKKGIHYYYVENGRCEYSEKIVNKPNAKVETVVLESGDLVIVKPQVINATKFLEDSVIYHFDTERREQSQYEKNTVRIKIVE